MALEILGERWLLQGKPKVGKSFMAASFPNPKVINGDGAANKYIYPQDARLDCYTMVDFKKALIDASQDPSWQTLILDTLDKLVIAINNSICKDKRFASIADVPHGGGWSRQVAMLNQYLEDFWATAERRPNLVASVIVAHSKKSDDGQTLSIRQSLHSAVQGGVNNIVYVSKHSTSGKLTFRANLSGSESMEAGCRNPTLQGAGTIDNDWTSVVKLFDPPPDKMYKALSWVQQKGGIDRDTFLQYAYARGRTTNFEIFELMKSMRDQPAMLKSVQADIERMTIQ
jgi:hypothetical protein